MKKSEENIEMTEEEYNERLDLIISASKVSEKYAEALVQTLKDEIEEENEYLTAGQIKCDVNGRAMSNIFNVGYMGF